jgi:hypothetical protein
MKLSLNYSLIWKFDCSICENPDMSQFFWKNVIFLPNYSEFSSKMSLFCQKINQNLARNLNTHSAFPAMESSVRRIISKTAMSAYLRITLLSDAECEKMLGNVMLGTVRLAYIWLNQVRSGQVGYVSFRLGQDRSGQVRSGQVRSGQVRSG